MIGIRKNNQYLWDRFGDLYSMKIKEQTRKLALGCSKHCFEVVNKTDEVSNIYLRQGDVDVVWRDFRRVLIDKIDLILVKWE